MIMPNALNDKITVELCVQVVNIYLLPYNILLIGTYSYSRVIRGKTLRNRFYGSHIGFLCIKKCQNVKFYCRNEFLDPKNPLYECFITKM